MSTPTLWTSETDAAYLAGLLDGEGTIGYRPRPGGWANIDLGICMTTPAPLYWAQSATGFGSIYHRQERRQNRRDAWFWRVGKASEIAMILRRVRPFMRVKQYEATAFLIMALLRECKSRPTGPSPYLKGEQMAGAMVQGWKRSGWQETAYQEALDLAVYLKQALVERDGWDR